MDALVPTNFSERRRGGLGDHAMRLKLAGTTSSASLINLGQGLLSGGVTLTTGVLLS